MPHHIIPQMSCTVHSSCKFWSPTERQFAGAHPRDVQAKRAQATQQVPNGLIVDLEHRHADGDILGRGVRCREQRLQQTGADMDQDQRIRPGINQQPQLRNCCKQVLLVTQVANATCKARTEQPGESTGPCIVNVLPLPVCPYAKMIALYPSATLQTSGATSSKTAAYRAAVASQSVAAGNACTHIMACQAAVHVLAAEL